MQTAPDIKQHTTAQAFAAHLALVGKDIQAWILDGRWPLPIPLRHGLRSPRPIGCCERCLRSQSNEPLQPCDLNC